MGATPTAETPMRHAIAPMRHAIALTAVLLLAACASDPGSRSDLPVISSLSQFITGLPGYQPEFGVAGLEAKKLPAGFDGFNNTEPGVAAAHAAQVCTLGYQTLVEGVVPGDPVGFVAWGVRCNAYRPSL
jgi:hypothetical protein